MLNQTINCPVVTATRYAPSMQGNCIEVIDILTRLSGSDMGNLASRFPFEFAALAELLRETRFAASALEALTKLPKGPL